MLTTVVKGKTEVFFCGAYWLFIWHSYVKSLFSKGNRCRILIQDFSFFKKSLPINVWIIPKDFFNVMFFHIGESGTRLPSK